MTHEERAAQVAQDVLGIVDTAVQIGELVRLRRLLAEQFREVEREAIEEASAKLGKWASVAILRITPEQLREVVCAGDALVKALRSPISLAKAVDAWDAATKGISRE